jgi:serine/threonine-protein kinase RsbW
VSRELETHVATSAPGDDVDRPPDTHVVPDLRRTDMPTTATALAEARAQLAAWAGTAGLDAEQIEDVALAAYEAMANVVDHAYDQPGGVFDLHACRHDDQVTVTVTDHGRWKSPAPGQHPWRGRGLLIIDRISREFELTRHAGGTVVSMNWSVLVE